jgi:hypothetical protein
MKLRREEGSMLVAEAQINESHCVKRPIKGKLFPG